MSDSLTTSQRRILTILESLGAASPEQLFRHPDITINKVMLHRHLKALQQNGAVEKYGKPPYVTYYPKHNKALEAINVQHQVKPHQYTDVINGTEISEDEEHLLSQYFGYNTYKAMLTGEAAFKTWFCEKQLPTLLKTQPKKKTQEEHLRQAFSTLLQQFIQLRIGLATTENSHHPIDATERYRSIHPNHIINAVYYKDFYSLPQYGKSLLGCKVQKAKIGDQRSLSHSQELAQVMEPTLTWMTKKHHCSAVAWVPHSLKRQYGLMPEWQKLSAIKLPTVRLVKTFYEEIIPQKTLSDLQQRIDNGFVSNHIAETPERIRSLEAVLIIDDAIGSAATIQGIAMKLKMMQPNLKIYALAIVGSYKGFDVIKDI